MKPLLYVRLAILTAFGGLAVWTGHDTPLIFFAASQILIEVSHE